MLFTDGEKTVLRFDFAILDKQKRGRGYGREMLSLAVRYSFDFLKAERITLGVLRLLTIATSRQAFRPYRGRV